MARKSLKPQLNQIRAWVRQGRTDAWIAHQLEVTGSQLRDFRRRHGLDAEGEEPPSDLDLRDEIEAEIEADLGDPDEDEDEDEEDEDEDKGSDDADADAEDSGDEAAKPRRRRRRGGRGRSRGRRKELEATFDHGDKDGYGLWLDPAVKDDPAYAEHWAEVRALKVTIEPERIVLERVED